MNTFAALTPQRWFRTILSILILLTVVYLLLHGWLPPGRSKTKLTPNDIATISSLLYTGLVTTPVSATANTTAPQADTLTVAERPLTDTLRGQVLAYIARTYPVRPDDMRGIRQWLGLFSRPANLMNALDDYIFSVYSYFWLYDGGLYAEVLFWTWFGLIASLLYSVSEGLRNGDEAFDRSEVWVHIAKFFYAPLIAIVLFVGLSLAINDKTIIERIDYSANQILVAFLMGFFSGRFVQLLQNIKNVLFPDAQTLTANNTSVTTPTTATDADIRLAVERLNDRWRLTYPNVTGIAVQTKQTQGQPTGQLSALFEVSSKISGLTTGVIPAFLPFTTPDGRLVNVPTDVVGVGTTRFAYSPGPSLHLNVPTAPGGSVRRADLSVWGTLGLRLQHGSMNYVLSCYHVLCADRLAKQDTSFSSVVGPLPAVVPGQGDTTTPIGEVTEGRFSSVDDFALVRLTDTKTVNTLPAGLQTSFFDIISEPGDEVVGKIAFMVGAKSNRQQAKILASYQAGEFELAGSPNQIMKGLIKTQRLADEGDSGAAVFIDDQGRSRVIGLLIGYNTDYSYILPIGRFCEAFKLSLP